MEQLYIDNELINVIGKRTVAPSTPRGSFWLMMSIAIFIVVLAVILNIVAFDTGTIISGIFFLLLAAGIALLGYKFFIVNYKPNEANNKCTTPTIGLRDDGVMVLFHYDGTKDYLPDRITDVSGCRAIQSWSTSSSSRAGNLVTTTTTHFARELSWGNVIFTLEKQGGMRYQKSVRFVVDCAETAALIKNMLS